MEVGDLLGREGEALLLVELLEVVLPLEVYLKKGLVKINLGLCKGKKEFDKRAAIKDRDVKRDIAREFRNRLDG